MNLDQMEIARATLAVQIATNRFLYDDPRKINLIDVAYYDKPGAPAGQLALRYHVDEKPPDIQLQAMGLAPLQEQPPILGLPTMVVVGKYEPHQFWWPYPTQTSDPRMMRTDPLRGGISICAQGFGSGTLGGIVVDRATERKMILSNWHVLVAGGGLRQGQPIYQPGQNDGGTADDVVGFLERDALDKQLDAAVASISGRRQLSNVPLGVAGAVLGAASASWGMQVLKSGRTSGVTQGRVTGLAGNLRLTYAGMERMIRDVMTIEPLYTGAEVSAAGDSGSWWLDTTSKRAVGLHFAGSSQPNRALAIDMQIVLDALGIDIPVLL